MGTINWSASSDVGAAFSPSTGSLSPGGQQQVSISGMSCQNGTFTFSGSGGVSSFQVAWTCASPSPTPSPSPSPSPPPPPSPKITVTPLNLAKTSSNCSPNSDGTYNCSVTVGETAPGRLSWHTYSFLGLAISPPSGTLSASHPQQSVVIASIPCHYARFAFIDQNGNRVVVIWRCQPGQATVTPTPANPMGSPATVASPLVGKKKWSGHRSQQRLTPSKL